MSRVSQVAGLLNEVVAAAFPTVSRVPTAAGLTTGTIAEAGKLQFVLVTSGGANDIIILPPPVVGTVVILHNGATGYELRSNSPTTVAINGGSGADAESAIPGDSTCIMICVTTTAWKGFYMDSDGDLAKVEAAA